MGALMDIMRSNYDYVDNPYWSLSQVKVSLLDENLQRQIGEYDKGKVLLFVNLSLEDSQKQESLQELKKLKHISEKYKDQGFSAYCTFPNDVQGGDNLTNKDILNQLKVWNFYNPAIVNPQIKFLQKMDINGNEMHNLYRVLKRQSNLFNHKYGKSARVKEHYCKFLADRYGIVRHYYGPSVEYPVIEVDIKKLLEEQFNEERFNKLLNPPDNFF